MTQTAAAMLIALGAGWYSPAPCVVGRHEIAGGLTSSAYSARVSDHIAIQSGPAVVIAPGWGANTREAPPAWATRPGNVVTPTPAGVSPPAPIPVVPLPAPAWLLLSGMAMLVLLRRRAAT